MSAIDAPPPAFVRREGRIVRLAATRSHDQLQALLRRVEGLSSALFVVMLLCMIAYMALLLLVLFPPYPPPGYGERLAAVAKFMAPAIAMFAVVFWASRRVDEVEEAVTRRARMDRRRKKT
jgi:uncharacterized membrane protein